MQEEPTQPPQAAEKMLPSCERAVRSPWARARAAAVNLSLVLSSLLVCLAAGEGYLRLFYPKYEYAAESQYDLDSRRIWVRQAHSVSSRAHPDTGVSHAVIHNNLAMRQHRNFSDGDIAGAVNLGFFGDSYTENLRLPSQYSFNEILDFLLNSPPPPPPPPAKHRDRFNVLNLGVDGYGTDQSFLYYEDFRYSAELDVVFYVFCSNDLRDIYEKRLFRLNETGQLARNPAIEPTPWVSLLSRFHMTYLVLDAASRLPLLTGALEDVAGRFFEAGERIDAKLAEEWEGRRNGAKAMALEADVSDGTPDSERAKDTGVIFQSLLRAWQQAVQERGGRFVVVILPIPREDRMTALIPSEIETMNLFECFNEYDAEYDYYRDVRFANDGHWNEQGNMLAAVCLYRFLERKMNLSVRSANELLEELYRYYSAFQAWMPTEEWTRPTSVHPQDLVAIRSKYLAEGLSRRGRLIVRSTFDLYLDGRHLTYAKAPCVPADTEAKFFLHVYPADTNDLPRTRQQHGFDNLDFSIDSTDAKFDESCLTTVRLPQYGIARVHTGQFVAETGRIWQEEFTFGADPT